MFLAIFMTTKLIGTEQVAQDLKSSKEIGVLLNPIETGFESAKSTSITMPVETRINTNCENDNKFGKQIINISQKSLGKWTDTKTQVKFPNKYIFSENLEGEKFYIFAKPFDSPFKVSDLIYITSNKQQYCFDDAPNNVKDELEFLNQENLVTENCREDSIKICFSGNCEIKVGSNYVEKDGERMYYNNDALMYAAIFSNSKNYECQVKRLMQRISTLSLIYIDKANFISRVNCNSNLNLESLRNAADNLGSSVNLNSVDTISKEIDNQNKFTECRLW